jgi:molybdenum cofactor cytidylyltransferase
LAALPEKSEGVLVIPGDQPVIVPEVVRCLLREFRSGSSAILVPTASGRRGHPVLFGRRYVTEVMGCYEGVGLRGLLRAHAADVREIEFEESTWFEDVDLPTDYERILTRLKSAEGAARGRAGRD